MNWKDKLHIIIGCAVIVAATNLITMPQAYADELETEHCVAMKVHTAEREYIERLEKLVSDLYLFKVQSNINIAEVAYRERNSTER